MLTRAFGYQGNAMALPVADVAAAVPFYEQVLGFRCASRDEQPQRAAMLERDAVQMRLVENGGDPTQDGCAFHVEGLDALLEEFHGNGLPKKQPAIDVETQEDGSSWRVFYVVAPDGLCYWFGERLVQRT
jgi:catechol 2,3-dioxygenase-like lactoylglutathione lyase family enzyme